MSEDKQWFGNFKLFHEDRKTIAPSWAIVLAIAFGVALALGAIKLHAAPQVNNAEECGLVADMVLVAAALREQDIGEEKRAGVMEAVYVSALGGADAKRWREIMEGAVRLAGRDFSKGFTAQELASEFSKACIDNRGQLEPIFGPNA